MKFEYLIFNLLVIIGPIFASFDRKVHYRSLWKIAFSAVFLSLIPFIVWDSLVSGKHWYFNEQYVLPLRILHLPIGEWLFFITVPFACLFVWQIIITFKPKETIKTRLLFAVPILLGAAFHFFMQHQIYTFLVCIALSLIILLDMLLKTNILAEKRTLLYILLIIGFTLVFNGYLTARPVVLYHTQFMTGIRIITIPIEDFGFGLAHILLTTIFYEKLKGILWQKR